MPSPLQELPFKSPFSLFLHSFFTAFTPPPTHLHVLMTESKVMIQIHKGERERERWKGVRTLATQVSKQETFPLLPLPSKVTRREEVIKTVHGLKGRDTQRPPSYVLPLPTLHSSVKSKTVQDQTDLTPALNYTHNDLLQSIILYFPLCPVSYLFVRV